MPYKFSNVLDDELLYERVRSFSGGMNAMIRETELPENVSPLLQNILINDAGHARNRFGYSLVGSAPAGTPRGLAFFDSPSSELLFLASATNLHTWDGSSWTTLSAWTMADAAVAMAQGGDYMYFSDGTNQWRRHDGSTLSAALGSGTGATGDPPVGATIMCWHTFRMFASGKSSASDTIWASDIAAGGTGTWNHTNFSFRVGYGEGQPIMGLASLQDYWLVVPKSNSIYLVQTDPVATGPAGDPGASDWPIMRLADGHGQVGKRAGCVHGNDYLFMSQDGVRSVRRMAGAAGQYELTPPLSQPMQPYIDRINPAAVSKVEAWSYKQYAFFAIPIDAATWPNYVLVYDGRLGIWHGFWTGWTPGCWVTTRFSDTPRLVWANSNGAVCEWLDHTSVDAVSTYQDNSSDVHAIVRTRSFQFLEPASDKDPAYLEMRFRQGNSKILVQFGADGESIKTWTCRLDSTSSLILPFYLPASLRVLRIVPIRCALDGLGPCNESFIEVQTVEGYMDLRNALVAAYLNTVENDELLYPVVEYPSREMRFGRAEFKFGDSDWRWGG